MQSSIHQRILANMFWVMRPIARFLFGAGVGFREFSDVAKAAFVDVATKEFGIRGRPTNVSRVAVMTGLTRKEVKKIRDKETMDLDNPTARRSPPAEVLHYWYTDRKYVAPDGMPLALPFSGEGRTFTSLVKLCAGDIPAGAMRTELLRIGAVQENQEGNLEVKKRHFVPANIDEKLMEGINFGLRPLVSTIAYNTDPRHENNPRFQRSVHTSMVNPSSLDEIQTTIKQMLSRYSAELDDYLSGLEVSADQSMDIGTVNVGVGLFYFEGEGKDDIAGSQGNPPENS